MKNVFSKLALAAVMLTGGLQSAHALQILTLRDTGPGGVTLTCDSLSVAACNVTYAGIGTFGVATLGGDTYLTFLGTVGAFSVRAEGQSNSPGTPTIGFGNATSLTVQRNGGADNVATPGLRTLLIDFVSTDFTSPTGPLKYLFGSASQNAANPSLITAGDNLFNIFNVNDANDATFTAGTTTTTTCNIVVSTSANCTAPTLTWGDVPAGYALRAQQAYSLHAGSQINATTSSSVQNVPEPMTTSLVAAALLGLGLASRRRASKKA